MDPLDGVGVDLDPAVIKVHAQAVPMGQQIAHGRGHRHLAGDAGHLLVDVDADGNLGGLSLIGMGPQGGADDRFVSPDLRLHQGATVVFSCRLPAGPSLGAMSWR